MYNTEACQWDGGDCCESTCVDGSYTCGYNGYDCVDPSGTTPLATTTTTATTTSVATTTSTLPIACDVEFPSYIGDAYCDALDDAYNTAACSWDGGDCCLHTCMTSDDYTCGVVGYSCRDPTSIDFGACPGVDSIFYGDGYCDTYNYALHLHLVSAIHIHMRFAVVVDCCDNMCSIIMHRTPLTATGMAAIAVKVHVRPPLVGTAMELFTIAWTLKLRILALSPIAKLSLHHGSAMAIATAQTVATILTFVAGTVATAARTRALTDLPQRDTTAPTGSNVLTQTRHFNSNRPHPRPQQRQLHPRQAPQRHQHRQQQARSQ